MTGAALSRRRSREMIEHRSWLRRQRAAELERVAWATGHIPANMVRTRAALLERDDSLRLKQHMAGTSPAPILPSCKPEGTPYVSLGAKELTRPGCASPAPRQGDFHPLWWLVAGLCIGWAISLLLLMQHTQVPQP